jgi:hypothetical protein
MFVVFAATVVVGDPIKVAAYPDEAATWLERNDLIGETDRLAHQDFVGNYLQLRFGRALPVFIDDRVDMYPLEVSQDYVDLLQGRDALDILDRYRVNLVLWELDAPLAALLQLSASWQEAYRDDRWVVYRRTG